MSGTTTVLNTASSSTLSAARSDRGLAPGGHRVRALRYTIRQRGKTVDNWPTAIETIVAAAVVVVAYFRYHP